MRRTFQNFFHHHELMRKTEKYEWEKYLMVDDYKLDKVWQKFKEIIGI